MDSLWLFAARRWELQHGARISGSDLAGTSRRSCAGSLDEAKEREPAGVRTGLRPSAAGTIVIGGGIASALLLLLNWPSGRWALTKINQRLQPLDRGGGRAIYAPSFRRRIPWPADSRLPGIFHDTCLHLSRPGLPGRRHGPRPVARLCRRPAGVRRGGRGAEAEALQADVRGAGERPDPDRERPAGADGGQHRRAAGAGGGRRLAPGRQGQLRRRPFPRRIFGAWRRPARSACPMRRGC